MESEGTSRWLRPCLYAFSSVASSAASVTWRREEGGGGGVKELDRGSVSECYLFFSPQVLSPGE